MKLKRITFKNASGAKLAGRIDFPDAGATRAFALFAHCFTCTKNFKAIAGISKVLTKNGISVMRFDFSGLGESEGEFSNTNFSSNVADMVDAAAYLEAHYQGPQLLLGHSFGGTACLQAAARIPSTAAVVTIGSPAEPRHVMQHLNGAQKRIDMEGEAEVLLAGRPFTIKQQFIDDIMGVQIKTILPDLNLPLLVMHSPLDEVVDIENAGLLFKRARHPKSFISLGDADHMMSDAGDAEYAGAVIAAWFGKYLRRM